MRTLPRRRRFHRDRTVSAAAAGWAVLATGCSTLPAPPTTAWSHADGRTEVNVLALRQRGRADCGAASLAAVMRHWGDPVTADDLERRLGPVPPDGYSLGDLRGAARERGFAAFLMSGTVADLRRHCSLGRPCIVVYRRDEGVNHSVVVVEVSGAADGGDAIIAIDPATGGLWSRSADWLTERWAPLGSPLLLVAKVEKIGP